MERTEETNKNESIAYTRLIIDDSAFNSIDDINNENNRNTQNTINLQQSQRISQAITLIITKMYFIHLLITIIAPIFFTKVIIDLDRSLNIMMGNTPFVEYKYVTVDLRRTSKTMLSMIGFSIYFALNIVYFILRIISLIKPYYNTPVYEIFANIKTYIRYSPILVGIFTLITGMSVLLVYKSAGMGGFIPIVSGFFMLQVLYLIIEIIFSYFKTFEYTIYKPSKKLMKVLFLSIYYINHIIILSLCLILIVYSTEFVPLAVLDSIIENGGMPNLQNNFSVVHKIRL
ncbi:hypothetical protein NEIRO03_2242 [Nematocida sp. AWRm78]|nr:hypothetical protein NEIRO02_2180 [Nematocida sp. AWRm79]KAI5186285.1 hypothetical protein NEIRO03_2242 [Nematocida sp. AWRm78]